MGDIRQRASQTMRLVIIVNMIEHSEAFKEDVGEKASLIHCTRDNNLFTKFMSMHEVDSFQE